MAVVPSHFETRQVVESGARTLEQFLEPRVQRWRWPVMLETGAIRVARNGEALQPITPSLSLRAGDVVTINPTHGDTWSRLINVATGFARDLIFAPRREGDAYLTNATAALARGSTARIVPDQVGTLYQLAEQFMALGDAPLRHVVLVSHGSEFASLLIPMREAEKPSAEPYTVTWETLTQAIEKGPGAGLSLDLRFWQDDGPRPTRPADLVTPQTRRADGRFAPMTVVIRGCQIGRHQTFLDKIRRAFDTSVDAVVAPKMFEAADFIGTGQRELIEYFQNDYVVRSREALTRDDLLRALRERQFSDWLGQPIPDQQWTDLVPARWEVHTPTPTRRYNVKVPGRAAPALMRDGFHLRPVAHSAVSNMMQREQPAPELIRAHLEAELERAGLFKTGPGTWPIWERFALSSKADFLDAWRYELVPGTKRTVKGWEVRMSFWMYEIRTAVVEDGTLVADYHLLTDGSQPLRTIDLNDRRIFGRSSPHKRKTIAEEI